MRWSFADHHVTIRTGNTLGHWYRYPHAFYVHDDIKLKPNLTLNVGLRYELPSVLKEKRDKGTNFVPGVGPVLLGTDQVLGINPALLGPASLYCKAWPGDTFERGSAARLHGLGPHGWFCLYTQVRTGDFW